MNTDFIQLKEVIPKLDFEIESFKESINKVVLRLGNYFIQTNSELYRNLTELGWFMADELPPIGIQDLISKKDYDKIDKLFVKYFKKKKRIIKNNTIDKYPHRRLLITASFKAHQRKQFELSIPLMLAQIDGICFEITNQNIFSKNNKYTTNVWVNKYRIDGLLGSMLEPLKAHPAMVAQIDQSKKYSRAVNRNGILHGRDLNYATEENSLKTISLLNYVSKTVYEINKKVTGGNNM